MIRQKSSPIPISWAVIIPSFSTRSGDIESILHIPPRPLFYYELRNHGLQANTSRGCAASSEELPDKPATLVGRCVVECTDCKMLSLRMSISSSSVSRLSKMLSSKSSSKKYTRQLQRQEMLITQDTNPCMLDGLVCRASGDYKKLAVIAGGTFRGIERK